MDRHHRQSSASTAVACFALAIGIAACAAATRSPVPVETGVPAVTSVPTEAAVPGEPSAAPGAFRIALANAPGNDISIVIQDASGTVTGAESGAAVDGASVEPYTVSVTNEDPTTLRLTWAGGPCDGEAALLIDASRRQLAVVEPECPGDAVAFDRVLLVHFSTPVDHASVEALLQDGTDTSS